MRALCQGGARTRGCGRWPAPGVRRPGDRHGWCGWKAQPGSERSASVGRGRSSVRRTSSAAAGTTPTPPPLPTQTTPPAQIDARTPVQAAVPPARTCPSWGPTEYESSSMPASRPRSARPEWSGPTSRPGRRSRSPCRNSRRGPGTAAPATHHARPPPPPSQAPSMPPRTPPSARAGAHARSTRWSASPASPRRAARRTSARATTRRGARGRGTAAPRAASRRTSRPGRSRTCRGAPCGSTRTARPGRWRRGRRLRGLVRGR